MGVKRTNFFGCAKGEGGVLAPGFLIAIWIDSIAPFFFSIFRNVEVRILPTSLFHDEIVFYGIFFSPLRFSILFCLESYEKNDEDLVIMEHLRIQ